MWSLTAADFAESVSTMLNTTGTLASRSRDLEALLHIYGY